MGFPGLLSECKVFMAELGIMEKDMLACNKMQWKRLLEQRITQLNRDEILEKIKDYKKLDFWKLKDEPFRMKSYLKTMNLSDARIMFGIQTKMTKTIKSHFYNDKKYSSELWQCSSKCAKISTIEHTKVCSQYSILRLNRDIINSDKDLVDFFKDVIKIRDENGSQLL